MRYGITCVLLFAIACGIYPASGTPPQDTSTTTRTNEMQLGSFSISLTVKDIEASKAFYEKLGFTVSGGDLKHKYLILQNGSCTVGLFQGMFDKNTLTFNPGWDSDCKALAEFQDVREIQQELKKRGLTPTVAADETTAGPAFITLVDPDGNPVLIDQHVPKP